MEQPMTEGRKRVVAIVAGMFMCRKLSVLMNPRSPEREAAFRDSIELAEELFRRLDRRWPLPPRPN